MTSVSTTSMVEIGGEMFDVVTTLTPHVVAPPDPAPDPTPVPPPPAKPNAVRIGTATYPLAGINPTAASNPAGAKYPPAFRGEDQIIAVMAPAETVTTNRYGLTVIVGGRGVILAVRDDMPSSKTTTAPVTTPVPSGGMVLACHGKARDWMLAHAEQGGMVELVQGAPAPTPAPVPVPIPEPSPSRASNIAVWVMMWPDSPRFDWASIPDEVTEARLAFLVNGGQPVGDGPWGLAGLQAGLAGFLKDRPDRFVSWAMGGGGYEVDISSVANYVDAVKAAERRWIPGAARFQGGNVDWESTKFRAAGDRVAAVLRQFKAERPGFFCSWSPNSSFRDDYAAVAARNLDVVDALGYQCYDIPGLTYTGGVHPNVQEVYRDKFLAVGVPADKLEIAMMIEPGRNDRWSLAQCQDAAQRVRAEFGVTRTAFWQAGRPEFPAWARAMRLINPT